MAHEDMEEPEKTKPKRGEKKEEVHGINIKRLDDGSFLYEVYSKDGMPCYEGKTYSYQGVDELLEAVEDDLSSPHIREGKESPVGTGERFKKLEHELEEREVGQTERGRKMAKALPGRTEAVKNPSALAAYIGRKKFGKTRFQALSVKGRRKVFK